jgi:hypothetical protein
MVICVPLAMRFEDNRTGIALIAQSVGTLRKTNKWDRDGDKNIEAINIGESDVTFVGQGQGVRFEFDTLLAGGIQYRRTRVALRNAELRPSPPSQFQNGRPVTNSSQYPVLLIGSITWWRKSFRQVFHYEVN